MAAGSGPVRRGTLLAGWSLPLLDELRVAGVGVRDCLRLLPLVLLVGRLQPSVGLLAGFMANLPEGWEGDWGSRYGASSFRNSGGLVVGEG